jgi:hypothetical protein
LLLQTFEEVCVPDIFAMLLVGGYSGIGKIRARAGGTQTHHCAPGVFLSAGNLTN